MDTFVARDRAAFVPFAAAVLPSLLILGEFTFIRLVAASIEDLEYLYAIQQIRGYYRSLVPDGLMFFADITLGNPRAAVTRAMGMSQSSLNVVYTAGGMIATINSILAGIGIALILRGAGLVIAVAASCGAITALVIYGLHLRWALSRYAAGLVVPTENRRVACPASTWSPVFAPIWAGAPAWRADRGGRGDRAGSRLRREAASVQLIGYASLALAEVRLATAPASRGPAPPDARARPPRIPPRPRRRVQPSRAQGKALRVRAAPDRGAASAAFWELSHRELDVLRLLASPCRKGRPPPNSTSPSTRSRHIRVIFRKLGVTSRAKAVARARELVLL